MNGGPYSQGQHLLVYTESQGAAAAFDDVPGITDGWATLQNSHYILQNPMKLDKAVGLGANITELRINTPAMRMISLPSMTPLIRAAAPGNNPAVVLYTGNEPIIPAIDEIAVETSNDAGVATRVIVGLFLKSMSPRLPQNGPIYTVRATSSITAGNLVWGEGTFTLQQALPAGRYQVVGMDVFGANLIFARLRFPEQGPLPGVLARQAVGDIPWWFWRNGNSGLFGEFESTAPPLLQLFGSAAPTTQTIYLDLIKVR